MIATKEITSHGWNLKNISLHSVYK